MGMTNGCADVSDKPRVAVVTIESPALSIIGWALLLTGFILQAFSVEKPNIKLAVPHGKPKINPHTGLPHSENWQEDSN